MEGRELEVAPGARRGGGLFGARGQAGRGDSQCFPGSKRGELNVREGDPGTIRSTLGRRGFDNWYKARGRSLDTWLETSPPPA